MAKLGQHNLQELNFRCHQIMVVHLESMMMIKWIKLKEQIVKVKRTNAELCQLECTATKGGPGGQVKR
jgi:hypothetical protein